MKSQNQKIKELKAKFQLEIADSNNTSIQRLRDINAELADLEENRCPGCGGEGEIPYITCNLPCRICDGTGKKK